MERALKGKGRSLSPAPLSQRAARQLWAAATGGEPWPKGWRVAWGRVTKRSILTKDAVACAHHPTKRFIFRENPPSDGIVEDALHEFAHVKRRPHDRVFRRIVQAFRSRCGLPPSRQPTRSM